MKAKNVVFIHGWASGPYVWLYQISNFKDKYTVHTPALIGYQNRALAVCAPAKDDIFNITADDIGNFIKNKNLSDVCLVGWSMGGMVGLKVASEFKDKISRLILIDTTAKFVQSPDFRCAISKAVVEKIHNRIKTDLKGTLDWFYKFCFSANERSRNEFGEILKLLGDFIAPFDKEVLLAGLDLLMKLDIRNLTSSIRIPTLIIHGRQDRVCPPEAAIFLNKAIKNSRIYFIENAGHAPFLTHPDEVNGLIEGFLLK